MKFQTAEGSDIEIAASEYYEYGPSYSIDGHLPFAVGDEVAVFYFPESPTEAKLDNFEEPWGWPISALKIGIGLTVLAAILSVLQARHRKKNMPDRIDPWYEIRGTEKPS